MTSNSLVKLNSLARCLIDCLIHEFDKHLEGPDSIVKKVVQYTSGDFKKVSLLGTVRWKRVFIVFDYDNPEHLDTCRVLGFQFKPSIRPFHPPAAPVHSTVNSWAHENERCHLSFPCQSQVCYYTMCLNLVTDLSSEITLSPKRNLPCRPPSSAIITDLATAEESTTNDLVTAKDGVAKHPHSDNETGSTRYNSENT